MRANIDTSINEVGGIVIIIVVMSVCLSVCLSVCMRDISISYWRILTKLSGMTDLGPMSSSRSDFGTDLIPNPESGIIVFFNFNRNC